MISYVGSTDKAIRDITITDENGERVIELNTDEEITGFLRGKATEYARIWKLIASEEFDVTTDSTTAATVGTVEFTGDVTKDDLLYVHIRDKEGKKNECYYGEDAFILPVALANGNSGSDNRIMYATIHVKSDGTYGMNYTPNGVYPSAWNPTAKTITIQSKYNASYTLTIDGTYVVEVYKLAVPTNVTLFEAGD